MFMARLTKMKFAAVASLVVLTGGLGLVPSVDPTPMATAATAKPVQERVPYSGKYPPQIKNGVTIYTKSKVAVYTVNGKVSRDVEFHNIFWKFTPKGGVLWYTKNYVNFGASGKGFYVLIDG